MLRNLVKATTVAACLMAATAARADLVTNGGFETGDFTGWTVSAGATSVQSNFDGFLPHSGNFFAALGDTSRSFPYGTLSQTITDNPGDTLTLSYWLGSDGATPNYFEADWNGTAIPGSIQVNSSDTRPDYINYQFTVTATGSDTLTFHEQNVPAYLALDDISLNPTTGVPEPMSILLLGAGILGAGLRIRNRRK